MKVLQINSFYQDGSTGKLTYALHQALTEQGFDSVVCYGRGRSTRDAHAHRLCSNFYAKANNGLSRITGVMYGGCLISTARLFSIIRREKPDVVHLQCINGYFVNLYRLIAWLKRRGIPTVLTLHAEFPYTANCGHALDCQGWLHGCGHCPRLRQETLSLFLDNTAYSFRRMQQAFDGFQDTLTVVSVSQWLESRASRSPILLGKNHCVIENGVDTAIFTPTPRTGAREALGWPEGKVLFHATAMFTDAPDHLKGGAYIIRLAQALAREGVQVMVAGNAKITGDLPENLHYLGQIQDQNKLALCYSAADLTVIASKKETFSMICAESLCCGTPIIGFQAGAPEQIALPEYSDFLPYGDLQGLCDCARSWLEKPVSQSQIARAGQLRYSQDRMAQNYIELYRRMTE